MGDVIQGSPEWHAIRVGKVTASRVADLIAKTKPGRAAVERRIASKKKQGAKKKTRRFSGDE